MAYSFDRSLDKAGIFCDRQLEFLTPELTARCTRRVYKAGDTICSKGDPLTCIYFIESGLVSDVTYDENGYSTSSFSLDNSNGSIGLMEVFCLQDRIISTIVAVEETSVLILPLWCVYEYFMNDIEILKKYSFILAKALLTNADRTRLHYLKGPDKVAYYLAHYCSELIGKQDPVIISEGYAAIAGQLGVSTKTVCRDVKKLMDMGLVGQSGKKLTVSREQFERLKEIE